MWRKSAAEPQLGVLNRLGDVEHRVAFGDRDDVEIDIAASDAAIDLG